MRATIRDIQNITQLSLSTISKYINGGNVRDKNRVILDDAIRQLDFKANHFARGLKSNRSHTIGVLVPRFDSQFFTALISYIEDEMRRFGYGIIVCGSRNSIDGEREALEFLINKKVDGLFVIPISNEGRHLLQCEQEKIPVVLIDNLVDDYETDGVVINNRQISRDIVKECLNYGHKHIGLITGESLGIYTLKCRCAGYEDALTAHGIPVDSSMIGMVPPTVAGGYEGLQEIIRDAPHCTAVFCTNYDMTLGALMAINEMNKKIGSDFSLFGFDCVELFDSISPKLTMVNQPMKEIALKATALLLGRLHDETDEGSCSVVTLRASIRHGESICDLRRHDS